MADCLRDERFVWAMRRVKVIWRMREHTATTWFRWLYDQHENSIRRLFPSGTPSTEMMRGCESYGQGGGMGFANPVDDRRVEGDLAHGPYGLPLLDYKCHLRQLVRLAGGDPTEGLWQDWVERLLWSLTRRGIVFRSPDNGTWQTTWLRNGFLSNAWCAQGRDIPHAPPMKPYESTERSSEGAPRLLIVIPSRWVSLSSFPDLRDDVVETIVRLWGPYRALPNRSQRLAYLRELVSRPQTSDEELAPHYEAWEEEIENTVSSEDQTGPEARRIAAEQTKIELSVREKHRKRSERARKRLRS